MTLQPVEFPAAVAPLAKAAPTIEVEDLTKVFGGRLAVDGLTFSVGKGEILGLLGPNGAGKTTTMRMLAGYTPATSGRAAIAGHDVTRDSFAARRCLGYLPESAPVYPEMTVRDYLAFMCEVKRRPRATRRAYVNRAIEECALGEVESRRIGNLSKGFRQRVGIAQAILGDPAVLILDEPTVGLDPRQIAEIRALVKGMAGVRTVLLSTHILPEVSMTCQKAVVIDRGRIVAAGTPEKLVSNIEREEPVMVTVEGDLTRACELVGRVPGVASVTVERSFGIRSALLRVEKRAGADPRKAISKALVQSGLELIEISSPGATLEDVFLSVISSAEGDESA